MSLARLIVQRVALGAVAIWTLLTIIFALFTMTRDWALETRIAMAAFGGGMDAEQLEQIREEYLAARGLDRPIHEQYVDWMGNMLTLQWGRSFQNYEPVFPTVMGATVETATYLLPAVAIAVVVGLGVGVYTALYRNAVHAELVRGGSYFGMGFPHFWIGMVILGLAAITPGFRSLDTTITPTEMPFFFGTVVPTLLLAMALSAAIVSYARAYCLQYVSADLTKLVRAKGGGRRDVARHVVRNAAIPLVSLVFTETFALLALSVFVIEALFGIDGLGLLVYNAVWARDLPVLLGATFVVVGAGVVGTVTQDVAYSRLDPRVDTGSR